MGSSLDYGFCFGPPKQYLKRPGSFSKQLRISLCTDLKEVFPLGLKFSVGGQGFGVCGLRVRVSHLNMQGRAILDECCAMVESPAIQVHFWI